MTPEVNIPIDVHAVESLDQHRSALNIESHGGSMTVYVVVTPTQWAYDQTTKVTTVAVKDGGSVRLEYR